ncbi:BTB/POZ domain-containing protein [Citrus sinensis]|uniref:BTB/POZ domain-containing protein n=1 Tax=Citrus sinensis TaxID=2711 RepID=A0ACB8L1X5_CITSI|nr:BTB/POZ domain-containing protein [Citrus sinensis]
MADSPGSPPSNAQTMDDGPDSPPSKLKEIQMPPSSPEDYVFDPTLCSGPKPPIDEELEHVPRPSLLEGFDSVAVNELHWPLNEIFPFSNQIHRAQTMDDSPDSPPSKLKEIQLAPEPEPDAHDNCSKYMRTATSRKATKITHTPTHTSADSPQLFCWVHCKPKGPGLPPFPKSPPPSPDASPLIDSILERAPTEWGSGMKSQEDLERMKTAFLRYDASFREQTPPDIQLKPRNDETLMPAHKSVLAARSKILGMPNLDGSYGRGGIVELPESREELEPLLEFLYVGSLPEEKIQKHIMTLSKAAYKYDIQYLGELCVRHSLSSLISSNDLEVLYLAYCCRHQALLEAALKLIVEEGEKRICCVKFINFANKYPLMLKLVRMALVMCRET